MQRRETLVVEYQRLQAIGLTPDQAAQRIDGASRATLDRWVTAYAAGGPLALADGRKRSGRRRSVMRLTNDELAAARAAVLTTNRNADAGSVPEGLRLAARRGELRPELVDELTERMRDGRGVPDALRRDLVIATSTVRQHRNPVEAGLDFISSPGSLMWIKDRRTGQERFARVGDVLEADDATVNFHVVVPWEMGGCPCSERWGVKVARFQWLVAIDRASRFVPAWSYTMRPTSAYRAEDITRLFSVTFRQHGVWERLCLERGSWESHQVDAMIEALGIERMTAWSPHQKPFIEGLFDLMWTKLSDLPGQVGRYRGEEAKVESIVQSCRRGATDPREHFPQLPAVLAALHRVTAERNAQPVHSENYGTWVPEERWLAQQAEARAFGRLRALTPETAWMFSPNVREWTVQGGLVGGTIQVMDGYSVRVDFAAEWLTEFDGAKVKAFFDLQASSAEATLVLSEPVRNHAAGEVLGTAVQVNKTASYARRVLGWGEDSSTAGLEMRRLQASAMRSEVRAILPGGRAGLHRTDVRDGLGRSAQVEGTPSAGPVQRASEPAAAAPQRRGKSIFSGATPNEWERQKRRLARMNSAYTTLGTAD